MRVRISVVGSSWSSWSARDSARSPTRPSLAAAATVPRGGQRRSLPVSDQGAPLHMPPSVTTLHRYCDTQIVARREGPRQDEEVQAAEDFCPKPHARVLIPPSALERSSESVVYPLGHRSLVTSTISAKDFTKPGRQPENAEGPRSAGLQGGK